MDYVLGYRYRIYPTKAQQQKIDMILGCCRFVYNHFLDICVSAWKNEKKAITFSQTNTLLENLKRDTNHLWLNEVDHIALEESLRNLDRAFRNFFNNRGNLPHFKLKHQHFQSYHTKNQEEEIQIRGTKIAIPHVGYVKIKLSRNFKGRILNATVTRTSTEKYFISLNVVVDADTFLSTNEGNEIGIDVGIKEFYNDSNGNIVHNPKILEKLQKDLTRIHRTFSRREKGGKNREKARLQLALIHEKIRNIRKDFLNKLSSQLVKENQMIAVESLKMEEMRKLPWFAAFISDEAWYEFFRQLEYKAKWHGCIVVKVPAMYPSSQTCHTCGYRNTKVKNLSIRKWECPRCHTVHDRDINAAKNILMKGKAIVGMN